MIHIRTLKEIQSHGFGALDNPSCECIKKGDHMRLLLTMLCLSILISTSAFSASPSAENERTLSIIKPDGVAADHIGEIISRFEKSGLKVVSLKMIKLNSDQAEKFGELHKDYPDLIKALNSGPIVVMVLEGADAATKNQQIMGAPDPQKAIKGTIRADFGKSMAQNAVYGSHSAEHAKEEIKVFFNEDEFVKK